LDHSFFSTDLAWPPAAWIANHLLCLIRRDAMPNDVVDIPSDPPKRHAL